MLIAILGTAEQWNELNRPGTEAEWLLLDSLENVPQNAGAVFILKEGTDVNYAAIKTTILINSVCLTLKEQSAPENVLRINGWPGFLSRSVWEIAGTIDENVKSIFTAINKKFTPVKDEPGFIAARILAMIINEAWFAFEDAVSSKEEIDIAMKLGTNYPFGPFEWGALIGENNIVALLKRLSTENKRYTPATLLQTRVHELIIKH